jgi:hypothetical protein
VTLQPFQQRVVNEKEALDENREKLDAFFRSDAFRSLNSTEKTDLSWQADAMAKYSAILARRIARFK